MGGMKKEGEDLKLRLGMRRFALMGADACLLCLTGILCHWLVAGKVSDINWVYLIGTVAVQVLGLAAARFYRVRIADSSLELVTRVASAIFVIWFVAFVHTLSRYGGHSQRLRIVLLNPCFSSVAVLGFRFVYRFTATQNSRKLMSGKPAALVYGAGETGTTIVRMANKNKFEYSIVGFIDDNPTLRDEIVLGIPVLGSIDDLEEAIRRQNVSALIIAISAISSEKIQRAVEVAKKHELTIKVVPNLFERDRQQKSIRDIDYADLLGRPLITIERGPITRMIEGKTVLVTGAGGSIGSEICRQVMTFGPRRLLLLDSDESELHDLCLRLLEYKAEWTPEIYPILCDVRDREKVFRSFEEHRPDLVFHAAAIKHVPLSEVYPEEAVKTNICGSYNVLLGAKRSGVPKVVVISTDKAVNPTNVMGATKRVMEMTASALSDDRTQICAVRFGNVIGSRGSMFPLFLEQIKAGLPITVTSKEIIRYFMAIPEAVGLVFQAATLAQGGEVMVLDMGEPINIYEFAKKLIYVFGDGRSSIRIVGLRPGEKLYEELLANKDTTIPTGNKKIFKAKVASALSPGDLEPMVEGFLAASTEEKLRMLHSLVPEWRPPEQVNSLKAGGAKA